MAKEGKWLLAGGGRRLKGVALRIVGFVYHKMEARDGDPGLFRATAGRNIGSRI